MALEQQYLAHARRILADGLQHDPGALAWARQLVEEHPLDGLEALALAVQAERDEALKWIERERYGRLTRRERSLGVTMRGVL